MAPFLDSGPVRAGVFFALGFGIATVLGALLGDVRLGLRTGAAVGLLAAAFAYVFVRPATADAPDSRDADSDEDPSATDSDEDPSAVDPDEDR